jgi:thiol:disulfide interchange protein DsbD
MRTCARCTGFAATLILGLVLLERTAGAQATAVPIPHGTLELVTEDQWIAPGHEFRLGLNYKLEKSWHIYWVNPGDSGEPPRVEWKLSAGLTPGAIEWPTPQRLGTSGIVDFGYEENVMLIVPMRADRSVADQQSVEVGAEVKVLVCREICIPGKVQLSLALPIKSQPPASEIRTSGLFAASRKSLPQPAPTNWKFNVYEGKESFILVANLGHRISSAVFFPLNESQISNSASQRVVPVGTGFRMTLQKSDQLLKPIARLKGVLVLSADRAYLIDVPVSKPAVLKNSSVTSRNSF